MKPDSMLVECEHIDDVQKEIADSGCGEACNKLAEVEPILAAFIFSNLTAIAGKMALSGVPTQVIQGANEDTLALILTCLQALRRGHFELWKDTMAGTQPEPPVQECPDSPKTGEESECEA
jgi:hypothetical protein